MKKIVVIGSSNTDMTVRSERFPETGQTLLGGDFMMSQGGKGANQAVAIARLGGRATFVAKVGDDMFGREACQSYAAEASIRIMYLSTSRRRRGWLLSMSTAAARTA